MRRPILEAVCDRVPADSMPESDARPAMVAEWSIFHGLSTLLLDGRVDAAKLGLADAGSLARYVTALFANCFAKTP